MFLNKKIKALGNASSRAVQAPGGFTLAQYHTDTWIQRHRVVCISLLLVFSFFYSALFVLIGAFLPAPFAVPIVVLLLLVIGFLPATDRAPTVILSRLTIFYLIALFCWPDYLAVSIPPLPWITAIRLVGFPLALALLICVSVSPKFRQTMAETMSVLPISWRAVTGLTVLGAVSIVVSDQSTASAGRFAVYLFNCTVIFFAAVYVFRVPGRTELVAKLLWFCGLLVTAIGIVEWRQSKLPWAGHIPSFFKIEDESVQRILAGGARAATGIYRVQSKFTTPLGLAEFYAYTLPFFIHLAVKSRSVIFRGVVALSIVPMIFVILKTDSRIGMIGLLSSTALYLLFYGIGIWRNRRDSPFGPAIVLAFPVIAMLMAGATLFISRLRAVTWGNGPQAASNETRRLMYEVGIPRILSNPIGVGIGRGAHELGFYNGAGVLTIDAYYLSVGLELGWIGLILFIWLFSASAFRFGVSSIRHQDSEIGYLMPISVILINFMIIKLVFSQTENHPLIYYVLGMGVALLWRGQQESREA